jgi:hypothetical protein
VLHSLSWVRLRHQALFGVKGGDYDWAARSPEAAVAQLKELTDAHDRASKKVRK